MRNVGLRRCVFLCFAVAGCGGTATESIGAGDGSLPVVQTEAEAQTETEVELPSGVESVTEAEAETATKKTETATEKTETAAVTDAYACKVVAAEEGGTRFPFASGSGGSYAGVCAEPGERALDTCWYTGPAACDPETEVCGGFRGSSDPNTGEHTLSGGQHMLCAYPCISDDECPAPSSGTARAACMRHPEFNPATDGGTCMLGCANGETCPDGFVCIEPGLGFGQSDGTTWPAPAQCVQYKALTL